MSIQSNDNKEIFSNLEAETMLMDAAKLFVAGKLKEADDGFEKLTKKFPKFYPGLLAYGDFLLKIDQPAQALIPFRQAVRLVAHEGIGYYLLGAAYLKMARFYFAEKALESANALLTEKDRIDVLAHLGRARLMQGRIEEARNLIGQALKKDYTNPYIHMDMAQTYVSTCDFDEAMKWVESAQALAPDNKFITVNARSIKKLKTDFDTMPPKKQVERREVMRSKEYNEQMRIQLLMESLKHSPATSDDLTEVTEELKIAGLSGQITMLRDPRAPGSREALEYIKAHEKLVHREKPLLPSDYKEFSAALFNKNSSIKEKKRALTILAHQGSRQALKILEEYNKNPDPKLRVWTTMAVEECRSFCERSSKSAPVVKIHKLDF